MTTYPVTHRRQEFTLLARHNIYYKLGKSIGIGKKPLQSQPPNSAGRVGCKVGSKFLTLVMQAKIGLPPL
jgi:hypothetical protein